MTLVERFLKYHEAECPMNAHQVQPTTRAADRKSQRCSRIKVSMT